ncbi:TolC family outer membrane protein [soil metagenome]
MRIRRKAGLLAAVMSSGLLCGLAGMAHGETLPEAIAMAYETNPQILSQRSLLRNADELYFRTNRAFGPTVTADVSVSTTGTFDTNPAFGDRFNDREGLGVGLTASQSIYSGGRLTANIRAQQASLLSQREALRRVEMQVLLSVVQDYVEVNRALQSLDIAQQNVTVLERARSEAQIRFEVGNNTRTDVKQAESRLAASQNSLAQAQASLANARAVYAQVVGQAPGKLDPEPSIADLLPPDVMTAFKIALENNPTLRSAYLSERQSAEQISAAKAAYLPNVSASVSAGYDPGVFDQRNNGNVTAALRLSIPLFTGFTTASTVRSAIETNKNDQIGIDSQRRAVQQQVTQAYNSLVSARQSIKSGLVGVDASAAAQAGTREEQQVGLKTTLDVLNAEQEFRSAQQSLVNSRANEYNASVQLLNAMGKLDTDTFKAKVERYDPKEHFDKINDFELPWEALVKTIDQIRTSPAPVRQPGDGEIIPTFDTP